MPGWLPYLICWGVFATDPSSSSRQRQRRRQQRGEGPAFGRNGRRSPGRNAGPVYGTPRGLYGQQLQQRGRGRERGVANPFHIII